MKTWRIKELSDLTQTSIRMLRHYDKIGLLTPSYREPNGYRCYTAPDLEKLEQVIALKYFGFSLSAIKSILQKNTNIYAHLQAQQQVIKKEAEHLQQVYQTLNAVLQGLSPSESPDCQDLITLIERFNMTNNLREKLKKSWAGKALSVEQFEDYLYLYEQFPQEFAKKEEIIAQINNKQVGEPQGPDGIRIIEFMHELSHKMNKFFAENVKLSASLLESIQSGKLTEFEISPEGAHWVARAGLAYWVTQWNQLYDKILDNMKHDPQGKEGQAIAQDWRNLINKYFTSGNKDFLTGILLWQEFARQDEEVKNMETMPSPKEMLKACHIKLLFNPEASAWIIKALESHS